MPNAPLEAHTRTKIDMRLRNLGWILDQRNKNCNVFQEQPKTIGQKKKLIGVSPDYVLYEKGSDSIIGIIEAKRSGENLDKAIQKSIDFYAKPLEAPIVFAYDDTFVLTKHVDSNRTLKIDGEELQDFIDELTTLRFVKEGPEILSAPEGLNLSRAELLSIFRETNNLLRKEGLRDGYERFSAFAEVLFLKLVDEMQKLNDHRNLPRTIDRRYCWSYFVEEFKNKPDDLLDFVKDTVWKQLQNSYGDIFTAPITIRNSSTFKEIIEKLNPINLTATDTDIKGDAFEYFLKTVTNGNKDLGEYFTPRHIVRTMTRLVNPVFGETVYDPFCGTGGFLLEAFKYLYLRCDIKNSEILHELKTNTIFGREFTSTARIAKMNMVLFGDGHSNIEQIDSLANPIDKKYDIVLSNIPYSQESEYGCYYGLNTKDADAICVKHIWDSLLPNGRATVVVPETFLYKGGIIGKVRELICRYSEKLSVISLPRGVFMPYTPTKTNILFFKKGGQFKHTYFFVIFNDGFELNTKRKAIDGESDIKKMLSNYPEENNIDGQATIITREDIENSEWNLRPFFYMEDIPNTNCDLTYLDNNIIRERNLKTDPRDFPDEKFKILEVSQNGIFISDSVLGCELNQEYKIVKTGDLVYNPYRINIGSVAVVPTYMNDMLVSPAYIVFESINNMFPPYYLLSILKNKRYLKIIMNYSLGSARASLPFEELCRIKIPIPRIKDITIFKQQNIQLDEYVTSLNISIDKISEGANDYIL